MRSKLLGCFLLTSVLLACNGDHQLYSGYVEGDNILLASPFYGVLETLKVQKGQQVAKGDVLFALDPKPQIMHITEVQGQLEQAQSILKDMKKPKRSSEIAAIEAQIKQTEAQIELAEIRVQRYQKLFNKQATDKDSFDAALANLHQQQDLKKQYQSNLALAQLGSRSDQIDAQQNQIKALSASLAIAQWDLAQKTIKAPAKGIIFDIFYRKGEFIAAQRPVLALLTPENVHIEFFVPVEALAQLKMRQEVRFECDGCKDENNHAIISYISPEAEYLPPVVYSRENNAKLVFRVLADIKGPTLFKPGLPVRVRV